MQAAVDASPIANMTLIVGNANGILYTYQKGDFPIDRQVTIESASKWLTGTLLMRLVEAGKISLDDRPQKYLPFWTSDAADSRSAITLGLLLSERSGFNATPLQGGCVSNALTTLDLCTRTIYALNVNTAPGTTFSYGPHHFQIAADIAQAAGGQSFDALFSSYVTGPLGMTSTDFTLASAANPWAAGGAESTARDYAKLLQAMLGGTFIRDLDGFTTARTTTAAKGFIPPSVRAAGDWQYALGSWVECDGSNFVAQCTGSRINSSPGLDGWLPWIDREHGYYALIATDIPGSTGDQQSVPLEQTLQPLIVAALSAR